MTEYLFFLFFFFFQNEKHFSIHIYDYVRMFTSQCFIMINLRHKIHHLPLINLSSAWEKKNRNEWNWCCRCKHVHVLVFVGLNIDTYYECYCVIVIVLLAIVSCLVSIFHIFFVFDFNERFAIFVIALAHHFIFISTFGGDGASHGCFRDLATFRHILNDISYDFWIKLVLGRFLGFNESY